MINLELFRHLLHEFSHIPGRDGKQWTEQDIAVAIGLEPPEFIRRLKGSAGTALQSQDVRAILYLLAHWKNITTRSQAQILLDLADCTVRDDEWEIAPFSELVVTGCATKLHERRDLHMVNREKHYEQLIDMVVQSNPIRLWTTDQDLRLTYLSREYTPVHTGMAWHDLRSNPDFCDEVLAAHEQALRGLPVKQYLLGEQGEVFVHVEPHYTTADTVDGCVGMIMPGGAHRRNLDDQAQFDMSAQHNSSIAQIIPALLHDMRNPLHHIGGYASTLLHHRKGLDEAVIDDALNIIRDEVGKLSALVMDLLSVALIEENKLNFEIETVDIEHLVQRAVHRWQDAEGHRFETVWSSTIPPIPGDANRLGQVLDNLLANVVYHTPPTTIAVIDIQVLQQNILVSIQDNGPGIKSEHIPFLFDHGHHNRNRAPREGRYGLGLFMCKMIIEQHGGHIEVESEVGSNTIIRFSLPRRYARTRRPRRQRQPSSGKRT